MFSRRSTRLAKALLKSETELSVTRQELVKVTKQRDEATASYRRVRAELAPPCACCGRYGDGCLCPDRCPGATLSE